MSIEPLIVVGLFLHLSWVCIAQFIANPALRQLRWWQHIAIIILVPSLATGILAWSLYAGLGGFTSSCLSLVAGILFHQALLITVSSRHLVMWRLALRNLSRRRRNTTLMVLGLLVGSAMVSSSLVVGDSMDATIRAEVLLRQDTSDIEVYGVEPVSGTRMELNETRMRSFGALLEFDSNSRALMDGYSVGRSKTISVFNEASGLGEPDAMWYAMDPELDEAGGWSLIGGEDGVSYSELAHEEAVLGEPVFVVNQVLAEELQAEAGDSVRVTWSVYDEYFQRTQITQNISLWKVVPMQGAAAVEGSKGGVLFSTLKTAQDLQQAVDRVNLVRISALGGVEDSLDAEARLLPHVKRLLDEVLIAEDAGLFVEGDVESSSISVGRSNAVGRLDGEMVRDLRNLSQELVPDSTTAELLQAPLFGLRSGEDTLTGLLSKEVGGIIADDGGYWYLHPAGVSYEAAIGNWYVWETADDTLLREAVLGDEGLLIAHDTGLTTVVIDGKDIEHDIPAGKARAVARDEGGYQLLMLEDGKPVLYYSNDLHNWTLNSLPEGSLAAVEDASLLSSSDALFLHLEGLLQVETWARNQSQWSLIADGAHQPLLLAETLFTKAQGRLTRIDSVAATSLGLPDLEVLSSTASQVWLSDDSIWTYGEDGVFSNASITTPSSCDGDAFSNVNDSLYCTSGIGIVIVEQGQESIRLATFTEVAGIGRLPLFVLAASGEVAGLPQAAPGEVRLSPWADAVLSDRERLTLIGFLAASRGNTSGLELEVGVGIPALPSPPGQPGITDVIVGMVDFGAAEHLAVASEDERSLVLFNSTSLASEQEMNDAVGNLSRWLDEKSDHQRTGLLIDRAKHDGIEISEQASGNLAALFIVFGSFTMIAGMLLVVNIFVMIAEERKVEMGMLRALGLQRPDLRALFVLEGSLVAAVSSALGSLLGLAVGWLVAAGFAWVLSSVEGAFVYDWTWQSLAAGFAVGFLVSWASLWGTALRNSRLNVVAAMRNLPSSRSQGPVWWSWLLLLGLAGASMVCLIWFVLSGKDGGFAHGLWSLIGILALLAIIPLLLYNLPQLLAARSSTAARLSRNASRNTISILGLSLMAWIILPDWLDPVRANLEPDEASFIIIGVTSVAAGVLLLTSLAPLLASALGRAASVTKRIGPVVPTALAYPLATPFRTALTIGMFSLTVFSVVVLAGYSAQFESYSDSFVDDVSGDFELLATTSSWDRPLPLEGDPSTWSWSDEVGPDDFDGLGVVSLGVVRYSDADADDAAETEKVYLLRGVDSGFAEHGGLPLHIWDEGFGDDSKVVWQAIATNPNLCILDASFGMEFQGGGDEDSPFNQILFSIGESILIIDPENPSISRELTVIGFLDEGSLWSAPGIWTGHLVVGEQFDARITRLYLSLPEGSSLEEREDMAVALERAFVDEGMEVNVIEISVKEFQQIIFAIFDIFQSYLMLGLVVGIAGLGVVTVRAVSERSHQTGILRALGFQRRMVVAGYLLELSWISILGILNGLLVGIGFHWYLYQRFWEAEGVAFTMPWASLFGIVLGSWVLILAATVIPVRRAARIHPAEALREVTF